MQTFNLTNFSNELHKFVSKPLKLKKILISTCKESLKINGWNISFCNAQLVIDSYNYIKTYSNINNIEHNLVHQVL